MAKFCHKGWEDHFHESFTINFSPIGDSMVIKTVKNFGDLFVITDIFVVEKVLSRIFEILHDLNRDIAGSDSRAFRSLLDQGSKRDGVWAL